MKTKKSRHVENARCTWRLCWDVMTGWLSIWLEGFSGKLIFDHLYLRVALAHTGSHHTIRFRTGKEIGQTLAAHDIIVLGPPWFMLLYWKLIGLVQWGEITCQRDIYGSLANAADSLEVELTRSILEPVYGLDVLLKVTKPYDWIRFMRQSLLRSGCKTLRELNSLTSALRPQPHVESQIDPHPLKYFPIHYRHRSQPLSKKHSLQ